MLCVTCSRRLAPDWKLCPFCGAAIPVRVVGHGEPPTPRSWEVWRRAREAFERGRGSQQSAEIAAHEAEDLAALVRATSPRLFIASLDAGMHEVTQLGTSDDLPAPLREGFAEFERAAKLGSATCLRPAITAMNHAVRGLVDVGALEPPILAELRDVTSNLADTGALAIHEQLPRIDSDLLSLGLRVIARIAKHPRERSALERFDAARAQLEWAAWAVFELGWEHVVEACPRAEFDLPHADKLFRLEHRISTSAQQLQELAADPDSRFTALLDEINRLAHMLPTDPRVQSLHHNAEMLALIRPHFMASWMTRANLELEANQMANARAEFLRLLDYDRVLAFRLMKLRGWGRHGVALTTSSLQWRIGEQRGALGLSEIDPDSIFVIHNNLWVGDHKIPIDEPDAPCFAEALRACVSHVTVRPGPAVCNCGAPGHWFRFSPEGATCRGCGLVLV